MLIIRGIITADDRGTGKGEAETKNGTLLDIPGNAILDMLAMYGRLKETKI